MNSSEPPRHLDQKIQKDTETNFPAPSKAQKTHRVSGRRVVLPDPKFESHEAQPVDERREAYHIETPSAPRSLIDSALRFMDRQLALFGPSPSSQSVSLVSMAGASLPATSALKKLKRFSHGSVVTIIKCWQEREGVRVEGFMWGRWPLHQKLNCAKGGRLNPGEDWTLQHVTLCYVSAWILSMETGTWRYVGAWVPALTKSGLFIYIIYSSTRINGTCFCLDSREAEPWYAT